METSDLTAKRIKKYLSEGKRFDNRSLGEFRNISIETGVSKNAEGSARVKIGDTEVLVGVKMDIAEPYPDSPDSGNLMVTTELLAMSSPRFENGPPKFPSIEIARIIDRGIRESKFIELEKLCIKNGEKVWCIFVDIYSINDDGNLLDAAGLGAIAALKNAKIPEYDEKQGKVLFGKLSKKSVPLSKELPILITVHKIGDSLIVDPIKEEEDISETRVSVGISNSVISSMQKGNEKSLSVEEVNDILTLIEKTEKELFKNIEKFLK